MSSIKDPRWATDTLYTGGPDNGTPTRVEPTSGLRAQGVEPSDVLTAQLFNELIGVHGDILHRYQLLEWAQTTAITDDALSKPGSAPYSPGGTQVIRWLNFDAAPGVYGMVDQNDDTLFSVTGYEWVGGGNITGMTGCHDLIGFENSILASGGGGVYIANQTFAPGSTPGTTWANVVSLTGARKFARDNHSRVGVAALTQGVRTSTAAGSGWVSATMPTPPSGTDSYTQLAFGAGVGWVAAGANGSSIVIATSTDGVTYTDRRATAPAGAFAAGLVFDGVNAFYLMSDANILYKSLDGITWTAIRDFSPTVFEMGLFRFGELSARDGAVWLPFRQGIAATTDGGATFQLVWHEGAFASTATIFQTINSVSFDGPRTMIAGQPPLCIGAVRYPFKTLG